MLYIYQKNGCPNTNNKYKNENIYKKYPLSNYYLFGVFLLKKETTPIKPVAAKCMNSTILDALLSGKQMYLLATVGKNQVLLNLKDKKGKARAFGIGFALPPL